jgi:isopenicillin N synthase-like dioxygenase
MSSNGTNGTKPPQQAPDSIPIVDFAEFSPDAPKATRKRIAEELVRACREVGFVYITNHGVPAKKLDRAFSVSRDFYNLPLESKKLAPHPPGWAVHRGYSWPGLEKVSNAISTDVDAKNRTDVDPEEARQKLLSEMRAVQDFKESYEVGSDENAEQPNVWLPDGVLDDWRPVMTEFYWICFEAAKNVLRALALGIGLEDEDRLLKLHSGHYNQLRLLHYPPIPASVLEQGEMERMPAHNDWSTITLLFQDDIGGLQVESPSEKGKFIDVDPVKGGMLVNIGDLMMRWSSDYLKSMACLTPPRE